ncbi:MAG: hypothetical protein ABFC92_09875 [Rectinema sp.]
MKTLADKIRRRLAAEHFDGSAVHLLNDSIDAYNDACLLGIEDMLPQIPCLRNIF